MKKSVLFILMLFFCVAGFAQDIINYTYDSSGNRVTREFDGVVMLSAKVTPPTDSTSNDGNDEEPHVIETPLSDELLVKIFPNPTDGIMRLEISGADNLDDSGYVIYDTKGKLLKQVNSLSYVQDINIQDLVDGTYVLSLRLNGQLSHWKIIKQ